MLRIPPPGVNLSCVYAADWWEASAEHGTRKVATK